MNEDLRPFSVPYITENEYKIKQHKLSELARKTKMKNLRMTVLEVNSGLL